MNDYNTAICIVGICLVITALVILINHLRTKKTIDTMRQSKGIFLKKALTRHAYPRLRPDSLII